MNFVSVNNVKLDDPLWSRHLTNVRDVVLPHMWKILNDQLENVEKSHCVENFKVAAGQASGEHHGPVFADSDIYKWLEAASYCLDDATGSELEKLCDQAIALIGAAQQPDGYINTYYTTVAPDQRWTNLMEGHELYCAGHLFEAAVAHHQATHKTTLLDIACRFADLIAATFGKNRKRGYPGHPEIELALIRLFNVTGKESYLELASYFINERGTGEYIFEQECNREGHSYIFPEMANFKADYFLAHLPVREQRSADGHAVRSMYLFTAMADLARLTGEAGLAEACERLYENTVHRRMYVTGGVGSSHTGERFTADFDLPSDSVYSETCASIGLMCFASRMWLLNGNKKCFDTWERALYNTVLSGMGEDGKHFFYVNPLEVTPSFVGKNPSLFHVKTQRQKWFGVACCPPNLARTLTSLRGYIYAMEDNRLYILSHIGSSFQEGGLYVKLKRHCDEYTLTIDGSPMEVLLRTPENSALTGGQIETTSDGYCLIQHTGGMKQYRYTIKPNIRILRAHPSVPALAGKVCVQRGSIIYCAEGTDNAVPLSALRLPVQAELTEEKADWLEEMPILKTTGFRVSEADWEQKLYDSRPSVYEPQEIRLIPYCHWGNRGENEMRVWLTER